MSKYFISSLLITVMDDVRESNCKSHDQLLAVPLEGSGVLTGNENPVPTEKLP
jgi:hypothetical protein